MILFFRLRFISSSSGMELLHIIITEIWLCGDFSSMWVMFSEKFDPTWNLIGLLKLLFTRFWKMVTRREEAWTLSWMPLKTIWQTTVSEFQYIKNVFFANYLRLLIFKRCFRSTFFKRFGIGIIRLFSNLYKTEHFCAIPPVLLQNRDCSCLALNWCRWWGPQYLI